MNHEIANILNPSAAGLHVLVVYDNLASGIKAKGLCDRLAQPFKPALPWALSFWSLSALALPLLAREAADEAAQTDLLIVVVDGDLALPPALKSWLSRSARGLRTRAGALVAQLHGILKMDQEASPAYACLKHIAEDSAVDFFAEVVAPADDKLSAPVASVYQRSHLLSLGLDAAFDRALKIISPRFKPLDPIATGSGLLNFSGGPGHAV